MPDFSLLDNFDKKHKRKEGAQPGNKNALSYSSIDEYPPEKQKTIKNFMTQIGVPEDKMDEVFFTYNRQRKSKIASGLLVGAPQDDKTALSRIFKTETIPGYIKKLDDEILKLSKMYSNPNQIKSALYKTFNKPEFTKVPEGVEAYNVFFDQKKKGLIFV